MKKNILVIDDSALMRRVISDIINADERFQVIEVAVNGLDGLNILQKKAEDFDAVLLDINMPRMNGIEMLAEMKAQNINATVIIVSTIAKEDAKETIRALELGAFDFIQKPESYLDIQSNLFADLLMECLTIATKAEPNPRKDIFIDSQPVRIASESSFKKTPVTLPQNAIKLVAIACSTGGPKALHTVIPSLPENLDASVLIVQHMPGGFTKSLADRLNELSKLTVKEAQDGEIISKGTVYIAKGGYQMRLKQQENGSFCLSVTEEPARRGLLPCADIMYESLENLKIDQITCVVLTGMGGDGTAGISKINEKQNIYVIAQNEETSIVYGMPKVIKEAGLVDEVVALKDISDAITKNVGVC